MILKKLSNDEEAADAEANVKFSFDRNDQGHETNQEQQIAVHHFGRRGHFCWEI